MCLRQERFSNIKTFKLWFWNIIMELESSCSYYDLYSGFLFTHTTNRIMTIVINVNICHSQYFVELIYANNLKVKIINIVIKYVLNILKSF